MGCVSSKPASGHAQVGTYVGIINFNLADGYTRTQFDKDMPGLAGAFKPGALPGLLAKRWLANDETGVYGGVYLWKDEASFLEFKTNGPWAKAISVNPAFTNATLRGFSIVDALTFPAEAIETVGYIGVVNFKLASGYTEAKFMEEMPGLAPAFKPGALPGLLSKRWLNSGDGTYGGVYFFKDEASFTTFKTEGPWAGAISVNPNFAGATLEGYPVHLGLTGLSEGQPATPPKHAQVGSYVCVVNFNLADGYSVEQFSKDMPGLTGVFKPGALPGLLGKRWMMNAEKGIYGGVYLWKDEASFTEFKTNGPWAGAISVNPNFTNATLRGFNIVDSLTYPADSIETVGYVGVVNFKLATGYTETAFLKDMQGLKGAFKPGALPGLLSKRWLSSGDGTYGGVYFFKDEASFKTFEKEGPWAGAISVNPQFAGATLEGFAVHLELTKASEGQP